MQASERVTLMTVHAAKGLEFGNVFVVGVEEDLFPSSMACGSLREIEEERRLLYVAITRAKRFCMLSYARSRFRNGQTVMPQPSRFLKDIDPKYLKYADGSGSSPYKHEPFMRDTFAGPRGWGFASAVPDPAGMKSVGRRRAAGEDAPVSPSVSRSHGDLHIGTVIEHLKFGLGRITDIDDSMPDVRITVDFDNSGTKTLLLKFAKFSVVSSD